MFRDRVIEHYRVRGYTVHESRKVRGRSGAVHFCDLVAEGPLGNLVVSFGDDGDFEGPELAAVRSAARDIGAVPVVAAATMLEAVHRAAREHGVVVLDEESLQKEAPAPPADLLPMATHAWPDPDRLRNKDPLPVTATGAGGADSGLWRHARHTATGGEGPGPTTVLAPPAVPRPTATPRPTAPEQTATAQRFAWLRKDAPRRTGDADAAPTPSGSGHTGITDIPMIRAAPAPPIVYAPVTRPTRNGFPWHWVWGPLLFGAASGIVLFLFALLFL